MRTIRRVAVLGAGTTGSALKGIDTAAVQKFVFKGVAQVTKKDQGVVWPKL